MPDGVYTFNKDIQRRILSLLWKDPTCWTIYQGCIKPKYFEDIIHMDICRVVQEYYEKYDTAPTANIVKQEIELMLDGSKTKMARAAEYRDELKRMRSFDTNELQYLRDQVVTFAKRQAMSEALTQSADIVVDGKEMSSIEYLVAGALGVGEDTHKMGTVFLTPDSVENRLAMYASDEDVVERISTGQPELDKIMYGGLARQELGVILAPPGKGKTTTLLNIGIGAVKAGYNVLHITFENNEQQTQRNYDCCLLGKNKAYLADEGNHKKVRDTLLRLCDKGFGYGQLIIKKFNVKSMSISDLKVWIRKLITFHQSEFIPDVIIIDYGALVKPDNGSFDKRFQLESIFEGMRNIAEVFNAAVWSGAQGNRESLSKRIVTKADLAEAFNIANIVDFMMAICQTEREKADLKLRYFITKQREERDSVLLDASINYETKVITINGEIDQFSGDNAGGGSETFDEDDE